MANVGIIATKRWVISLINSVLKKHNPVKELTEECLTGETYNGKKIYIKIFDITPIATQANTWVSTSIVKASTNINLVIDAKGYEDGGHYNQVYPLVVESNNNQTYVRIMHNRASSSVTFSKILLKYTKTTD